MASARHITAHGNVQGVFFRDNTRSRARDRDVTGWVRNNPDGTVEMWLEGDSSALDEIEGWVRDGGPPRADVQRVEVDDVEPEGHASFQVKH